jgi:hypothetical protein
MLGRLEYALSTLEKPLMNGAMGMTLQSLDLRCGRYCMLSILNFKFYFILFCNWAVSSRPYSHLG